MERVLSHDDTDQSEEQTSLLSESLIKRQCNCKPTYRVRKLKNKGAIIVFVWNFFIASVFNHLMAFIVPYGLEITMATLGLTLLLAGWLADIHFGHYKVIRWSMWIMWAASILNAINSIVAQCIPGYQGIHKGMSVTITFIIIAIGFGGYQANVIQFGLDQLQDASTTEITAFISSGMFGHISAMGLFLISPMYV